jgi:predicted Zn-dependent protease
MFKKIVCAAILTIFLAACSNVPITGRTQLSLISQQQIVDLSDAQYSEFIANNPPLKNSDAEMVKRVGAKISKAVEEFMIKQGRQYQLSGFDWEFNLVNNKEKNAWALPGGKVVVYSGILPIAGEEDGIATIMGHEIAHVVANHGNERMSQELLLKYGYATLQEVFGENPGLAKSVFLEVYGVGSSLGMLKYSRTHEYEADRLGIIFTAMAGYDPRKSLEFWERMSADSTAAVPEFLSTHPSSISRISRIKESMPEFMGYYSK